MGITSRNIIVTSVNSGEILNAIPKYTISNDIVTWKKKVFTQEDIKRGSHRFMWQLVDDGETICTGNCTIYTFSKNDEGKYIKIYSLINFLKKVEQSFVYYVEPQHQTDIRIKLVKADKTSAMTGDIIKCSVEYHRQQKVVSEDKVPKSTKDNVKWMMKIGNNEEERLIIDDIVMRSGNISFKIPKDWGGKEVVLMPFLNKHTKEIAAKISCTSDTMNYKVVPSTGKIEKDFSKPVQINAYKINNRNASITTINRLKGTEKMRCSVVESAIQKITNDYNKQYSSDFPDDYYVICGKLMYALSISQLQQEKDIVPEYFRKYTALDYVCKLVDGNEGFHNGLGAPLFHIYENVVRKNDDTGIDKLLHFLYSAKWAFMTNDRIAKALGYTKEFINDEIYSWFSNDKGWDNLDIKANKKGIEFGKSLTK